MQQTKLPKIGFVFLGCPKNLVDSERILTELRAEGYLISAEYAQADLVIVNTCGFIEHAIEESLSAIGEALSENGKVIVTGCLGVKADQIKQRHPQVLAITGPHSYEQVLSQVHKYLPKPAHSNFSSLLPAVGIKLTPRHYAYLKISEGCDNRCTFCIIPSLRGELQSRPIGTILDEAKRLVASGVKELIIIAQDTPAYGKDIHHRIGFWNGQPLKTNIVHLCEQLAQLGIWIRLHYVYPYPAVDELIPFMAAGKIVPYLDMPLQHASPRILKLMRRPGTVARTLQSIARWREICPSLTLRSTFIVGFPGESEEDFQLLLDFLQQAQLDRVGCFKYSEVEGAQANTFANPVDEEIKESRYHQLMQLQQQISADRLQQKVGQEMQVLIDEINHEESYAIGRTPGDAPEIDGIVRIDNIVDAQVGQFMRVAVTAADEYDLVAYPI